MRIAKSRVKEGAQPFRGQARKQTSQRRPSHDRQCSVSITARPMRALLTSVSVGARAPVGQALTHHSCSHM